MSGLVLAVIGYGLGIVTGYALFTTKAPKRNARGQFCK